MTKGNESAKTVEKKAEKKANDSGYSSTLARATQATGKPITASRGGSIHRPRARDNSR